MTVGPNKHSAARLLGTSIIAFGVVALLSSIAASIATDRASIDLLQVVVIFNGIAVRRGGRRAVFWGAVLTGFYALVALALLVVFMCGLGIRGFGDPDATIRTRPWMIAGLLPLVAWTMLNFLGCVRLQRAWSRESGGLCPKCAYDLRGTTSKTCPECGATR